MERKTVRYKWDAHSTLAALQAIAASPRYRVHFFPPPGGACLVDKWKAERDLTLQLLAGSLWLDDAVRLGLASRVGGVCRPTDKWTSSTSTPVRSLLVKLRERLHRRDGQNYFEKEGARRSWKTEADVPYKKRYFLAEHPYYFLLLELAGTEEAELPEPEADEREAKGRKRPRLRVVSSSDESEGEEQTVVAPVRRVTSPLYSHRAPTVSEVTAKPKRKEQPRVAAAKTKVSPSPSPSPLPSPLPAPPRAIVRAEQIGTRQNPIKVEPSPSPSPPLHPSPLPTARSLPQWKVARIPKKAQSPPALTIPKTELSTPAPTSVASPMPRRSSATAKPAPLTIKLEPADTLRTDIPNTPLLALENLSLTRGTKPPSLRSISGSDSDTSSNSRRSSSDTEGNNQPLPLSWANSYRRSTNPPVKPSNSPAVPPRPVAPLHHVDPVPQSQAISTQAIVNYPHQENNVVAPLLTSLPVEGATEVKQASTRVLSPRQPPSPSTPAPATQTTAPAAPHLGPAAPPPSLTGGAATSATSLKPFNATQETYNIGNTVQWLMHSEPTVQKDLVTIVGIGPPTSTSAQLEAYLAMFQELLDPQGVKGRQFSHSAVRQVCTVPFLTGCRVYSPYPDGLMEQILLLLETAGMSRLNEAEFESHSGTDYKRLVRLVAPPHGDPHFKRRIQGREDEPIYWEMSPFTFLTIVKYTFLHNIHEIRLKEGRGAGKP